MRPKPDQAALKEMNHLFSLALENEKNSANYIKKARLIAKRHNIILPKQFRKKFCHKCNALLEGRGETRLSNGKISTKCMKCGKITRVPFKS